MTHHEIRDELLAQHADLRSKIEEVRAAMARWESGAAARRDVLECLSRLSDAARAHNAREEELLGGVIPTVDAWGPVRAEMMNDDHVKEHAALYGALTEAASLQEPKPMGPLVRKLLEAMLAHMAHEERYFLADELFCDDVVRVEFGG